MKNIRIKNIISLGLNILTAALAAAAVGWFFFGEGLKSGAGNMKSGGFGCLMFFTNDSNILAALCGIVIIPFNIKSVKSGKNEIPKWALVLKLVGTTAVTVTLTVVLFFLGPIIGYGEMFEGNCFFLHLVCPVISIISFCFCEGGAFITKTEALPGVLPTLVYGTVYLVNVIFTKSWTDFYHFNIGGRWYISCVVMLAVTYVLALSLRTLHNKFGG